MTPKALTMYLDSFETGRKYKVQVLQSCLWFYAMDRECMSFWFDSSQDATTYGFHRKLCLQ